MTIRSKKLILCLLASLLSCTKTKPPVADNSSDSLVLANALDNAIQIAHKNIHLEHFADTFETVSGHGLPLSTDVSLNVISGKTYLVIHRETPSVVYTSVYARERDAFKKLLDVDNGALTFTADTLYDVNGDGREDFLVNWYGSSGCCLKNFYDVYLSKVDGTFSEKYEFINPTFSPAEKIIRGVCYGQPGETELYKYRWNGDAVDTLEYIYPNPNKKGAYLKSGSLPWHKKTNDTIVHLNAVPPEYTGIYGYDWFTGSL